VNAPQRVRVAHPRTDAARRGPHRHPLHEIDEQTELGEVYMSSLIRSQRRLAVLVCGAVTVVLAGTALAGAVVHWFARTRLFGIALPWLVLGLLVYPVLIGVGWYFVRHAERNEHAFTELLHRR
jgi:uncharacterized membrane protein